MDPRPTLTRGVTAGLRLGRGAADRVVTLAGPPLGRLSDMVVSRVRGTAPTRTATFTPSKGGADASAPSAPSPAGPNPATVARNIGPQRPMAKPTPKSRAKPKSAPGAKLPPPRTSTS